MSQNLLNDFVGNAEPVKIRSQPAPKRVPAVPRNLLRFESGLNHFSHQCVEVQRVPPEISKNKSLGRISAGRTATRRKAQGVLRLEE